MKHYVHRYQVIRVKVEVDALDHAEAMKKADDYLAQHDPVHARSSGMGGEHYPAPKWLEVESAEEVTGYVVEKVADDGGPDYEDSKSYGADRELEKPHG